MMPHTIKAHSLLVQLFAAMLITTSLQASQAQETYTKDVGPLVCESVRKAMQTTETEWHQKLDRGYQWWPHWYRQKITASDKLDSFAVAISKITVETEILKGVSTDDQLYEKLAKLNQDATTSALIYIPESGQIISYSSVQAHEQNLEFASLLAKITAAMQVTEVAANAGQIRSILGGAFQKSETPGGYARKTPDDMTNFALSIVIPAGNTASVFIGEECPRADREVGKWSLLTSASTDGLAAEFEWEKGSVPTIVQIGQSDKDPKTETVLLHISAKERHSKMGNGMRIILALPLDVPTEVGPEIANRMNLAERLEMSTGHQYGSWTYLPPFTTPEIDPFVKNNQWLRKDGPTGTLLHVAFLPNATYFPGITSILFQSSAMRSRWAKGWIDKHTDLRVESKPN